MFWSVQRRLHLRYKDVISVCVLNNPNHRNVNTFLTDSNIFVKRSNKPAERCILLQRAWIKITGLQLQQESKLHVSDVPTFWKAKETPVILHRKAAAAEISELIWDRSMCWTHVLQPHWEKWLPALDRRITGGMCWTSDSRRRWMVVNFLLGKGALICCLVARVCRSQLLTLSLR